MYSVFMICSFTAWALSIICSITIVTSFRPLSSICCNLYLPCCLLCNFISYDKFQIVNFLIYLPFYSIFVLPIWFAVVLNLFYKTWNNLIFIPFLRISQKPWIYKLSAFCCSTCSINLRFINCRFDPGQLNKQFVFSFEKFDQELVV